MIEKLTELTEVLNTSCKELVELCGAIPLRAAETRKERAEVKEMLAKSEGELEGVMHCCLLEMFRVDPQCTAGRNQTILREIFDEAENVVENVTAFAECWKKVPLGPWDQDVEDDHIRSLKVVQMKSEVRMLVEATKAAEALRRGELDPLQVVLDQVQFTQLEDEYKVLFAS